MPLFESAQKKLEQAIATLERAMSLKSYRRLAINFLILSVNLAIIILYFALGEAKIIITAKVEAITRQTSIPIENEEQILTRPVELEMPFAVSSYTTQAGQAEGEITIYNTTDRREQLLVENTQFINSDGEIIRTRDRVTLSPGQTVKIQGYSPGPGGAVASGRYQILKLPYLKDQIYGEVTAEFTGWEKQVKTITKEFFNNTFQEMILLMQTQAEQDWTAEGYELKDSKQIDIALNKIDRDGEIGDTGKDFLTIKAAGLASFVIFEKEDALARAKMDWLDNLPAGKILVEFLEDKTEFVPVVEEKILLVKTSARVKDEISENSFDKKELIGKNRDEVKEYLKGKLSVADIEVWFWPFWVRSVPSLENHVKVEIR